MAPTTTSAPASSTGTTTRRTARAPDLLDRRGLVVVVVAAALGRLAVAVTSFARHPVQLVPDESQYLGLAEAVAGGAGAESWFPGYGEALYRSTWVFSAPLALLFRVVPPSRLPAQLYVALFAVLAAAATVLLARRVLPPHWAAVAGLVVALLPSQVIWSSIVLRESFIWLGLVGLALAVATSAPATGRRLLLCGVAAVACLLWLGHLRDQTTVVAAWALAVAGWLGPRHGRWVRGAGATAIAVLVPVVLGLGPLGWALVSVSAPNLGKARTVVGVDANSRTPSGSVITGTDSSGCPIGAPRDEPSSGGTPTTTPGAMAIAGSRTLSVDGQTVVCSPGGDAYVVEDGLARDLAYLPNGVAAVLLRPFPWESGSTPEVRLAAFENVVWYVLYVLAAIGVVVGRRRLDVLAFPILAIAALVATGALTQGNLGTAFRHRGQLLWALSLLAAVGGKWLLDRRRAAT